MGLTRSEIDAQLAELYARIPAIPDCDGRCWTSCGPIGMSDRERQRIRAAGTRITPYEQAMASADRFWCDALTSGKRCAVYDLRPLVCFLPETWVYTGQGPKRIGEILAGEQVYGADGQLHLVVATSSRIHRGNVIDVRHTGTHVAAWCTPDHQWLTVLQRDKRKPPAPYWDRADALVPKRHHQPGSYLCYPRLFADRAPLSVLDVGSFVAGRAEGGCLLPFTSGKAVRDRTQAVPARLDVTSDLLFMLGVYLAEGNASSQGAQFTMSPHEKPILERIAKYLDGLGIPAVLRTGRSATLSVSSALFGRLLRELCGTSGYGRRGGSGKRLHPALFGQFSHAQLWEIYLGWDTGDGRKCLREQEMSTTTTSEWLAVQMGFVGLACGMFPRTYVSHRSDRNGASYDVHLFPSNWRDCKPGYGTKNMADENYVYSPASADGQGRSVHGYRHYEGPVIDLQVDGAESFVTSSGIAHNCRLWGAVEGMPCVYGCKPEGGYLSNAEGYRLVAESLRIGGAPQQSGAAGIDEGMADESTRAAVEQIRARGRAGELSRAAEHVPPAFRRPGQRG